VLSGADLSEAKLDRAVFGDAKAKDIEPIATDCLVLGFVKLDTCPLLNIGDCAPATSRTTTTVWQRV
jgi:hypothetical protein